MKWRTLAGYSAYEISDNGLVRRSKSDKNHPSWHGRKPGQLLAPSGNYKSYCLTGDNKKQKYFTINRLVLLAFVGPAPSNKHDAAHINDDKTDNSLSNLYWATKEQNMADKIRNDKIPIGERHWKAKLKASDIETLKLLRKAGLTYREIGEKYNIGLTAIYKVVKGISWAK